MTNVEKKEANQRLMNYFNRMNSIISDNAYMIHKGVRSCALIEDVVGYEDKSLGNEIDILETLLEFEQTVLRYKLKCVWFKYPDSACENDGLQHYSFWIYKYPHQLPLIKIVEEKLPNDDFICNWIIGKLLGYHDSEMENFLANHLYDKVSIDLADEFKNINFKGE